MGLVRTFPKSNNPDKRKKRPVEKHYEIIILHCI